VPSLSPWPYLGCVWANAKTNGEFFFRVFFWYHNVQSRPGRRRSFGGNIHGGTRPGVCWSMPAWSLALIQAAIWFVRRGIWRIDPQARLGVCWLIASWPFFPCAKFKRADYLLPAYPGPGFILGCVRRTLLAGSASALSSRLRHRYGGLIANGHSGSWLYFLHVELAASASRTGVKNICP